MVYDTQNKDAYPVSQPSLNLSIKDAGSLDFTAFQGHPYYNEIKKPHAFVTVYRESDELFYGRIIDYTENNIEGSIQVHCEGATTFLLDSEVPKLAKTTETVSAFFTRCINAHNALVETAKKFTVGTVSIDKASSSESFEVSRFQKAKDAIESQLISRFGGFLRVRHNANGPHYLDYISSYNHSSSQLVKLGHNIIEKSDKVSGDSLFTVFRPVGKDDITIDSLTQSDIQIPNCTKDGELLKLTDLIAQHGTILETKSFSDISNKTALLREAEAYITKRRAHLPASSEIKFVDFYHLNPEIAAVSIGDSFSNIEGFSGQTLVVAEMDLDLEDPANDSMFLQNAEEFENQGRSNYTASSAARGGAGGYMGHVHKYIQELDEEVQIHTKDIRITAEEVLQLSGKVTQITGRNIFLTANTDPNNPGRISIAVQDELAMSQDDPGHYLAQLQSAWIDTTGTAPELKVDKLELVVGSQIWQQRDSVTTLAGKFVIDQQTGNVKVIEGASLQVAKNGVYSEVVDQNGMESYVQQEIDAITSSVADDITQSVVQQTSTYVQQQVRTKSKVYRQWGDPKDNPNNELNDGDIWIVDSGLRTWADAQYNTWNNSKAYQWDDYYGTVQKVWKSSINDWVQTDSWKDVVNNSIVLRQEKDRITVFGEELGRFQTEMEITAQHLNTKFTDKAKGLESSLKLTAEALDLKFTNKTSQLESSLTITAEQLTSTFTDRANDLQSQITQSANRIALVVNDTTGTIKAAEIVAAINNGASSIRLSADHIQLDGDVSLAGKFTLENGDLKIRGNASTQGTLTIGTTLYANTIAFGVSSSSTAYLTSSNISNVITALRVVPPESGSNSYAIEKQTVGSSSWTNVGNFSRATSLSGSWSGNTYTVTASPQGNTISTTITRPTASDISLGSFQYVTSQGASSMPSATTLTTLKSLMTSNVQGFVYFTATLSGGSGTKWYRVATIN